MGGGGLTPSPTCSTIPGGGSGVSSDAPPPVGATSACSCRSISSINARSLRRGAALIYHPTHTQGHTAAMLFVRRARARETEPARGALLACDAARPHTARGLFALKRRMQHAATPKAECTREAKATLSSLSPLPSCPMLVSFPPRRASAPLLTSGASSGRRLSNPCSS